MRASIRFGAAAVLLALASLPVLNGQGATGSLGGLVLDPAGAAVPAVTITARQAATGQTYETVSTAAGLYVFPSMVTGEYEVTAEASGFKKVSLSPIVIRTATRLALDLNLELGDVTETVEVTGTAPLLETIESQRGDNISTEMMATLPLFTGGIRRGNAFTRYMPGVNTARGDLVSVNGSGGRAKEILVEGGSLTIPESGGIDFSFPAAEMFSEVKMITSTYSAEHGRFGGGVEVYNAKSGANAMHGAAFLNLRRDIFNAAGWISNARPGNPAGFRAKERFTEAGGALGGPVWIPKVYDGRNKTFWYTTYSSDERPSNPTATTSSVPLAAMKQGNFAGSGQTVYDPMTTSGDLRDPFPNNTIPESRFSSVSRNILPFIPDPSFNQIGSNFSFLNQNVLSNYIWSLKLDHNITDDLKVSYFQTNENNTRDRLTALPGPLSQGLTDQGVTTWHPRWNVDWIISPSMLLHSTYSYSRRDQSWDNAHQRGFASQIGLPVSTDATPRVQFETDDQLTPWGVQDGKVNNGFQKNRTFHFSQSLSVVRSKHEFKMGYDIRYLQTNANDAAGSNGLFTYARAQTALPTDLDGNDGTGHSFASFLLGFPNNASTTALPVPDVQIRYRYYAGYFQDNWKVLPNLTLNLGIRYSVPIGWHMANHQSSSFDPTIPNAAAGGLPGGVIFPGPGAGRTGTDRLYPTDFSSVGPRAGFSWKAANKTVVRGGFGVYYQTLGNGGCGCTLGFSGPPAQVTSDGLNPAIQWDGGIPRPPGFTVPPFIDPTIANGQFVEYQGPNFGQAPQYLNWSFSIQQQIQKFLVDLSYLGNRGDGLNSTTLLNQLDPAHLSLGPLLSKGIDDPDVQAAGFSTPYEGFTGSLAQSLRPFPHINEVRSRNTGDGKVWYDAFQAKLERRFGGTQINANYTYSKSLSKLHLRQIFSQGRPLNSYNLDSEKTISPYNIPHQFNMLGFFDLPFGRGKRYFSSTNGAADLALGGWQVGLIMQYRSGLPLTISAPNSLSNILFNGRRSANPGSVALRSGVSRGDLDPNDSSIRYFNPGAFVAPGEFELGYASPRQVNFRNTPVFNENLSLVKNFTLWNRSDNPVRFIARADAFNIFNRTNFRVNGSVLSGNFGRAGNPQVGQRRINVGLRIQF